jgi:hypothetical protein
MIDNLNVNKSWLDCLGEEDITFIKRFLLASGSLKEIARIYGITYPTIRLRLDRLIEKIKIWDSREPMSDYEKLIRILYAEQKIDMHTLKLLLQAYQADTEKNHEKSDTDY